MHRSRWSWRRSKLILRFRRTDSAADAGNEHARLPHPGRRFARSAPQLRSLLGADRIARISEEVIGKRPQAARESSAPTARESRFFSDRSEPQTRFASDRGDRSGSDRNGQGIMIDESPRVSRALIRKSMQTALEALGPRIS
jgi:hypothetical protein